MPAAARQSPDAGQLTAGRRAAAPRHAAARRGPEPTSIAVTFLPGDPPRTGSLLLYQLDAARRNGSPGASANAHAAGRRPSDASALLRLATLADEAEVVLPTAGGGVRRRVVPARRLSAAGALVALDDLGSAGEDVVGAAVWAAALRAGLSMIARGRLYPAVTAAGYDAWRVGPLDPADRRFLAELAAAFPVPAYAVALGAPGAIRLRSPEHLVLSAWDALADTLVRTAAAPLVLPPAQRAERDRGVRIGQGAASQVTRAPVSATPVPFAGRQPVRVEHLRPWLADAGGGLDGAGGAEVALRIELLDGPLPARAVIQLTSRAESSLVVDAEELYASPAAVIARFGEDAESDLLRALRRVARAWPPARSRCCASAPRRCSSSRRSSWSSCSPTAPASCREPACSCSGRQSCSPTACASMPRSRRRPASSWRRASRSTPSSSSAGRRPSMASS